MGDRIPLRDMPPLRHASPGATRAVEPMQPAPAERPLVARLTVHFDAASSAMRSLDVDLRGTPAELRAVFDALAQSFASR